MSCGKFISSERDLRERNEWLRVNAQAVKPFLKNGKDCIVQAFTRTASSDRLTTRIGELPYWPSGKPWPFCETCSEPLGFAAQLDFRHETVRSTVPGDVLTFHYCFACRPWADDEAGKSLLTWHKASPEEMLVEQAVVPSCIEDDEPGPAFGIPVEAVDFPTPVEAFGGSIIEGERYTYLQFTLQGTKIGGYPPSIQPFEAPRDSKSRPMRFLGTIGSLKVSTLPPRKRKDPACGDLMWGDRGSVYLWISGRSRHTETTWFIKCY